MNKFENFIEQLSNQELLTVKIYKWDELNTQQQQFIDDKIKSRGLSLNQNEMLSTQIRSTAINCPRCHSQKLISNEKEKFPDFKTIILTWKYLFQGFKVDYECQVCGLLFKKLISKRYLIELFKNY